MTDSRHYNSLQCTKLHNARLGQQHNLSFWQDDVTLPRDDAALPQDANYARGLIKSSITLTPVKCNYLNMFAGTQC